MKFKHEGVFVPVNSKNVTERIFNSVITEKRVDRDKIPRLIKKSAVSDGQIDRYAIRNHWTLALGQTQIINEPWNSVDEAKNDLMDIDDVTSVKHKTSKTKSCYVGRTESSRPMNQDIRKKLSKDVPIFRGKTGFEVQTRFMWVGDGNFFFDDIEEVWGEKFDL